MFLPITLFILHRTKADQINILSLHVVNEVIDESLVLSGESTCSGNGFYSASEGSPRCNCFNGFAGTLCELNVKATNCSQMDCGVSGVQGECIVGSDGIAVCFCYPGWSGERCVVQVEDVETVDYCEGISCNNQGICTVDLYSV